MADGDTTTETRGLGPFITYIETVRPDGVLATWESRRHRKSSAGLDESTWWAPAARGWWIAVLFAVGSFLFALGAVPGYVSAVGDSADAITFFVGSVFFTSAGFLQYREAVDAGAKAPLVGWHRIFTVQSDQLGWWACAVQSVGTLFFNVSTAYAIDLTLSSTMARHHVWRPDALGSICFLIASGLAWFEVCHGWWDWRPGDISWSITALNMTGSIAFGVSAIAAFIVPSTGELLSLELTNLGTFVGALCFLAGAVLLLPERTLAA